MFSFHTKPYISQDWTMETRDWAIGNNLGIQNANELRLLQFINLAIESEKL